MVSERAYVVNPGWGLLLKDMGVSEANVFRRAGLPLDLHSREGFRVSTAEYYAMWGALAEEVGDPALPIKVVEAISSEAFEPVVFAATCSRNLNIAAARIAQHEKLIGPKRVGVTVSATETVVELRWPEHAPPPPALGTTELLFWVALARLATRTRMQPARITMPHPPADAETFSEYLGIYIETGPSYRIAFSAVDAARPFLTANDGMWNFFEPELRKRLSELDVNATMAERVQAALVELLPAGLASIDAVSSDLAVSARTLQRRLMAEGTSFQWVLGHTRESLARHYISKSDLPVDEISFLLGFEDPHSFYRAFKAWTGATPQSVRFDSRV